MYEFWCDYVKQKYGGKANFHRIHKNRLYL